MIHKKNFMLCAKFTKFYDLITKKNSFGAVYQQKNIKNTSSLAINLKLYKVCPVHKRIFLYQFYHVSINIERFTKNKFK